MGMVIEGFLTTKAVYEVVQERNIDMPISQEVYKVLYEGKDINSSFKDLMSRQLSSEEE
jgi:glycerol-3-phosphate dehydrogenase (NAD(P)+)